jgi:hypothetical protein
MLDDTPYTCDRIWDLKCLIVLTMKILTSGASRLDPVLSSIILCPPLLAVNPKVVLSLVASRNTSDAFYAFRTLYGLRLGSRLVNIERRTTC